MMSRGASSSASKPAVKDSVKNSGGTEPSKDESADRERVLKEVGFTSSTFIGPAFPPKAAKVKSDIDDSLSQFYKELEKLDAVDGANEGPNSADRRPGRTSSSRENTGDTRAERNQRLSRCYEMEGSGQKETSWQHWYQNEPYPTRRPRSNLDLMCDRAALAQNQRHHPLPFNGPPNPRFHRPPYIPPPPPCPFPYTPDQGGPHSWGGRGARPPFQEEPRFDPNWMSHPPNNGSYPPNEGSYPTNDVSYSRNDISYPHNRGSYPPNRGSYPPNDVSYPPNRGSYPPNEGSYPPQGFDRDPPPDYGRERWDDRYEAPPQNANAGHSGGERGAWLQHSKDCDWRPRSETGNGPWEQRDQSGAYSPLVLILMRGLPGSGKSTLAKELVSTGPSGLILSADDYFAHSDSYHYDPGLIGEAHQWNQDRAKEAMHDGRSPLIIDNTNIEAWEMKPYVQMALERGYRVDFREPDTSWKFDLFALERKNKHGVPQDKIGRMLERFSFPISVDVVLRSQEPRHVTARPQPEQRHIRSQTQEYH
ncbi:uncharacterized protein n4bp2l2 [Genypterus blacodes]|uniref:uncharacterized protein n4bp2l2 n=1 Tax=Genypterus blacodes TaxID=154954 RepID=UPI003F75F950